MLFSSRVGCIQAYPSQKPDQLDVLSSVSRKAALLAALFLLLLLEPFHLLVELVTSRREVLRLLAIRNVEHLVLESGALAVDINQPVELLALQQRESMTGGAREIKAPEKGKVGDIVTQGMRQNVLFACGIRWRWNRPPGLQTWRA